MFDSVNIADLVRESRLQVVWIIFFHDFWSIFDRFSPVSLEAFLFDYFGEFGC
jgi:hypothetical protein